MATASDIYRAALAKNFDDYTVIEPGELIQSLFPQQLITAMTLCLDIQNSRRAAQGQPALTREYIASLRLPYNSPVEVPFDDYFCNVLFPLYIASENLRDAGRADLSAYLYEQFTSLLNEQTQYVMESVVSVF